jgi:hypothetical protein
MKYQATPLGAVFGALCLLLPGRALAVDDFEYQLYGAQPVGHREFVPQLLTSYVGKSADPNPDSGYSTQHLVRTALELEYGFAPKVDVAYYLNLALPDGDTPQYAGSKLRFHGAVNDAGTWPFDMGWYAEVEQWNAAFNDDSWELELMLIFQKSVGPFTFILDAPDIDKVLAGANVNHVFELGYRAEIRFELTPEVHLGLQGFGGIGAVDAPDAPKDQAHYIAPVVHVLLPGNIRGSFGFLFGLTPSTDPYVGKMNLTFNSHERFWD